jgi:hypothetical protein
MKQTSQLFWTERGRYCRHHHDNQASGCQSGLHVVAQVCTLVHVLAYTLWRRYVDSWETLCVVHGHGTALMPQSGQRVAPDPPGRCCLGTTVGNCRPTTSSVTGDSTSTGRNSLPTYIQYMCVCLESISLLQLEISPLGLAESIGRGKVPSGVSPLPTHLEDPNQYQHAAWTLLAPDGIATLSYS